MQPEQAQEVRGWFQKAANDLRGADIDLAASPPLIKDALRERQNWRGAEMVVLPERFNLRLRPG